MAVTFSNKFSTTLSSGINNSVTSLSIASATGFPSLSGGKHTYVTLDNGDGTTVEVVKVTGISGTTLTVTRGQDSTSAAAFSSGAKVELRVTAAILQDVKDEGPDESVLKVDQSNNRVGILNASPDVSLDAGSATDALHVPSGTTGQRPGSPAAGYFRWNSTESQFEGYDGSDWGEIGGGGATLAVDNFTGDGSDTTFTMAADPLTENNTDVFVDGVYQFKNTYSVSGTTLTFSEAPANGALVEVMRISASAVTIGTPDDNTVSTVKLVNDAVTYAKIQNVSATDRLLGRDSSGAGIIEEITPANVRTMLNVADGANAYVHPNHSGDVTSSADGATTIAADAVTYAKMQNVSATDRLLGRDSSGAGIIEEIAPADVRTMINVADGANAYVHPNHSGDVTSSADGATTIANNAVTTAKIADSTGASDGVTTAKIATSAVTTAKIGDDQVTGAKLNPALVQGDIIYADGTDTITRLAKGSAAQVLTMNGGATAPSWADAAGGGLSLQATPKTGTFTAVAGEQYLVDTSTSALTMTFPASPSVGDTVGVIDYAGTFHTNNLTLGRNSVNVLRAAADGVINTQNWSTNWMYVHATPGWLPVGQE